MKPESAASLALELTLVLGLTVHALLWAWTIPRAMLLLARLAMTRNSMAATTALSFLIPSVTRTGTVSIRAFPDPIAPNCRKLRSVTSIHERLATHERGLPP